MKAGDCRKCGFIALLKDSGESSPGEELFLKRHLASCDSCREETVFLQKIPRPGQAEVQAGVLSRIKSDSREVIAARSKFFPVTPFLKPAFAFFAAAALVLYIFFFRGDKNDFESLFFADEYRILDERISSAEDSMQALSLEFFTGNEGF